MTHRPMYGNLDSGVLEIFACEIRNPQKFAVESGVLGFGIRNRAQGIRNPTNEWNPESTFY